MQSKYFLQFGNNGYSGVGIHRASNREFVIMGPSSVLQLLSYFMFLLYISIKYLTDFEMTVRKRKECSLCIISLTHDISSSSWSQPQIALANTSPSTIEYRQVIWHGNFHELIIFHIKNVLSFVLNSLVLNFIMHLLHWGAKSRIYPHHFVLSLLLPTLPKKTPNILGWESSCYEVLNDPEECNFITPECL